MNKIKNIAIIHSTFAYNGGAENLILWTVEEWKKLGINVDIYTRTIRKESNINQKYTKIELNPFTFSKTGKYLCEELSSYDAILIENFPSSIFFGIAKKEAKKKNITLPKSFWYCHEPSVRLYGYDEKTYSNKKNTFDIISRYTVYLDKKGISEIDYIFANSIRTAEHIKRVYEREAYVIYPAIPKKNNKNMADLKAKYFFYIGRIEKPKNLETAIESFKIMLEKTKRTDIKFIISGKGRYENNIKKHIDKLQMNENVIMTGYINDSDKQKYLSESYAMLSLSSNEPFGLTAVEAFSEKSTCIISKYSGASEIAKNGINAVVVDPNNIDEITNAMIKLIEDEAFLKTLKNNAYEFFESGKFSIEHHAKTLLENIEKNI